MNRVLIPLTLTLSPLGRWNKNVMTLVETLILVGMEEKEAKIYLAGLELGPATVLQLSKKAEVKRPTTYVLLDQMIEKGYVAKTIKRGNPLYIVERPSALVHAVREKERTLTESFPLLEAIAATAKERPKITIHESAIGVRQVYSQMLESKEVCLFGSIREVNKYFSDAVAEVAQTSRNKKPHMRDILAKTPEDIQFAKHVMRENPNYHVRFAPTGLAFLSDCAIYGDRVAIFAVQSDFFAVVIQSPEVAQSFRTIHELAWRSAEQIKF